MFSSTQQLSGKIRALEAVPTSSSIRRSLRMMASPRSRVKMGASVASDKGGTSFLPFILSAATGACKRFRRGWGDEDVTIYALCTTVRYFAPHPRFRML